MKESLKPKFEWHIARPKSSADTMRRLLSVLESVGSPRRVSIQSLMHAKTLGGTAEEVLGAMEQEAARLEKHPYDLLEQVAMQFPAAPNQSQSPTLRLNLGERGVTPKFTLENAKANPRLIQDLVTACQDQFGYDTWQRALSQSDLEPTRARIEAIDEAFARQVERMNGYFERFATAQEDAAQRHEKREAALQAETKRRKREHDKRLAALEATHGERMDALEMREREVDEKDPFKVRRDLQDKTRDLLKEHEAFEVSPATSQSRLPVHALSVIGLGLSVGLYVWVALRILAGRDYDVFVIGMLVTATLLFFSVFWFYVRFLSAWFTRRSDAEVRVRALREDWMRASWLAELLFSWETVQGNREGQNRDLPELVFTALSRGLYEVDRERDRTALKEVVSALPRLKRVDFGKYGGVDLDGSSA